MVSNFKVLVLIAVLLSSLSSNIATSRLLDFRPTLAARLKLDQEGSSTCWDSLLQLQSCTDEVVLFFLNGETYLGPACCQAIKTIEGDCWPAMLGSIGYTSEEGVILRGYCDASDSGEVASAVRSPPQTN